MTFFSQTCSNLTLVPEEDEDSDPLHRQEREQDDLITGLPYELALYVFSLLCFDELVRVQLVRMKNNKKERGGEVQVVQSTWAR
jgi:hypothetical protein